MGKSQRQLEYESNLTPAQVEEQRRYLRDLEEKSPKNVFLRFISGIPSFLGSIPNAISNAWADDLVRQLMIICGIVGLVIAGILGIVALVHHFTDQGNWVGSLSELHYRREKYIEQYIVADGGDWWNTQPSLSYNNTYAGDRVRSYHTEYYWTTCTKSVPKTYRDSDGDLHTKYVTETYSCQQSKQVPDYDRWFTYNINRWGVVKTIFTEERQNLTEHTLTAVWPVPDGLIREFGTSACSKQQLGTAKLKIIDGQSMVQSEQANDPLLGCQRVSVNQSEKYYITYSYTADKKPFTFECGIDYSAWSLLRVGMAAYGKYYMHNEGFDCNDGHIGTPPKEEKAS